MSLIEEVRGVVVTGEDRSGRPETSAQEVSWNSPEIKACQGGRKGGEGHSVKSALSRKFFRINNTYRAVNCSKEDFALGSTTSFFSR